MPPAAPGEVSGDAAPAWKNLKGMKRVQAEFKHLSKDIAAGKFDFIKELSLAGDDLLTWQLKLWHFDVDCEGGRNLNKDLEQLSRRYGQDHILMEVSFPRDYPHQPFFIRVVSPRCVMYTGHVTAGGSICLESLTLSGTPGSWQPDYSVESLLNVILVNMIDCPVTRVQTATGPGGVSGPLRVDFNHYRPTLGYSSAEAQSAFARTLENHRRMGWGGEGGAGAAGSGSYHAAAAGARTAVAAAAAAASRQGPSYPYQHAAGPPPLFGSSSVPYWNNSAAAAAAAASAAGAVVDGRQQLKRRSNAAAAAGGNASGAAAHHVGSQPHQPNQGLSPSKRLRSSAAATGTKETIDLLSDSDDEDQDLRAALQESLSMATATETAVAGAAGRRRAPAAAAAPAAAVVLGDEDDDCIDDDGVVGVHERAAGRQRDRQPLARQRQQPGGAHAGMIVDSGSDEDGTMALGTPGSRRPSRAAAAASGRTARDPQHQQQRAVRRRTAGQQQDDVLIVASQGDDDVQVVGGKPAPAAAVAAAAATAAVNAGMRRVRRAINDLQQNQQRVAAQVMQFTPAAAVVVAPALPVAAPIMQLQQQQQAAPALLSAQFQQQVAAVQQQLHSPDGFVGARVQLQLEYPSYWDYNQPIDSSTVRLVPLPLNSNTQTSASLPSDPLEAAAVTAQLSQEDIDQLQMQGLARADAVAALLLADGDVDDAVIRATTCLDVGGCAEMWKSMNRRRKRQGQDDREAQETLRQQQEAAARRAAEEVKSVLSMFESSSSGTLNRSRVVSIERIQHSRLWKRYCLKRQEIIESRGDAGLNERLLFHGTSPGTVDIIIKEGFDFRLVSHSSAYGNGTYFADHSSTAFSYCAKPDATAATRNGFGAGSGWGPGLVANAGLFAPNFMPPSMMPGAPPHLAAPGIMAGGAAAGAAWATMTGARWSSKAAKSAARAAAAQQQQQSGAGCYKMLVARVALGRQGVGQPGMRKPPEGCDSVNSGSAQVPGMGMSGAGHAAATGRSSGRRGAAWGAQQGQQYFCHVVFDNDQCYPEYLITFRPR